jgi:hypothetical protein
MNPDNPSDRFSRLSVVWEPTELLSEDDLVLDSFRHFISAGDGLPPYSQARIIDAIANELRKSGRPDPCLWVSVDAPGTWYIEEIIRLVKHKIPILVLPAGKRMESNWDYKPHARPQARPAEIPQLGHRFALEDYELTKSALRVLRILARFRSAYTREITSLAGFSETHVRTQLRGLQADNLIERKKIGKYDGWQIRQNGLRLAHRSWNIPKGMHFAPFRREYRYAGERHRRVARMWREWLEKAYSDTEIWECWTEVPVQRGIPDALAWGRHNGREMLFWLEVDTGHTSRKKMKKIYSQRIQLAGRHAYTWAIPIVFCIMGPRWVVTSICDLRLDISSRLAIIAHEWWNVGRLPMYRMGEMTHDLHYSGGWRQRRRSAGLSFEPQTYPRKAKEKKFKRSKPKSTKPKFNSPHYVEEHDGWYMYSGRAGLDERD